MCYPKVTELPEGEWFCGYCRARSKFIAKVEDVKQEIAEKKSNTIDAVPSGATEDSAPRPRMRPKLLLRTRRR